MYIPSYSHVSHFWFSEIWIKKTYQYCGSKTILPIPGKYPTVFFLLHCFGSCTIQYSYNILDPKKSQISIHCWCKMLLDISQCIFSKHQIWFLLDELRYLWSNLCVSKAWKSECCKFFYRKNSDMLKLTSSSPESGRLISSFASRYLPGLSLLS